MIDLHCHIVPGVDDGAATLGVSLSMARLLVADGVVAVACTPHILPGVYHNSGPDILASVARLRDAFEEAAIPLELVAGADAHIAPDFVGQLARGQILSLANSRYVLVEPPHDRAPPRLEQVFFDILLSGYVPIFTHPERMRWIGEHYRLVRRLAQSGVWMQLTSGSLTGRFGPRARYWGERMLEEGLIHLLASDAHDAIRRPPDLSQGYRKAAARIGAVAARHLVVTRPRGILENACPFSLLYPPGNLHASQSHTPTLDRDAWSSRA